jgi:hypothetical protein
LNKNISLSNITFAVLELGTDTFLKQYELPIGEAKTIIVYSKIGLEKAWPIAKNLKTIFV